MYPPFAQIQMGARSLYCIDLEISTLTELLKHSRHLFSDNLLHLCLYNNFENKRLSDLARYPPQLTALGMSRHGRAHATETL